MKILRGHDAQTKCEDDTTPALTPTLFEADVLSLLPSHIIDDAGIMYGSPTSSASPMPTPPQLSSQVYSPTSSTTTLRDTVEELTPSPRSAVSQTQPLFPKCSPTSLGCSMTSAAPTLRDNRATSVSPQDQNVVLSPAELGGTSSVSSCTGSRSTSPTSPTEVRDSSPARSSQFQPLTFSSEIPAKQFESPIMTPSSTAPPDRGPSLMSFKDGLPVAAQGTLKAWLSDGRRGPYAR